MRNPRKAFTTVEVIIVVALLGALGLMVAKPKFLSGEARRADQSQQATQEVQKTQDALDDAHKKKSAEAAASVTQIVRAAGDAEPSPQTNFIQREGQLALTKLEAPDPLALLAAEQRYTAFLEGKVELIDKLYTQAHKEAQKLNNEVVRLTNERDEAMAHREAVDQKLIVKAAEHLATERQRNIAILAVVVIGALWLWAKLTHFSPIQMKNAVLDIKSGAEPIVALDTSATPLQQRIVNLLTRILK